MENNEFKSTMEVWKFLESAFNDNIETLNKINNIASSLLNNLNRDVKHSINENGEYVILRTNVKVNKI
jgi:hypothetical protein